VLVQLRIQNLAVFAEASLLPSPRLTVVSGETGAGKSLMVGAVLLLLGDRGGGDRVRAGAERATVEGVFELTDATGWAEWLDARGVVHALPGDPTLVLKRDVSAAGRSRAWINGGPVTTALLGDVGRRLVTVLGQHEAQALAEPDPQREALDAFAQASELADRVAAAYSEWRAALASAHDVGRARAEATKRADYLRFVLQEISDARLVDGESEQLDAELTRLSHAEELRDLAAQASERLDGDDDAGVLAQLHAVRRSLQQLARIDLGMGRLLELLDQAEVPLSDLSRELTGYLEQVEVDPRRLRDVEARRSLVQSVLRKHGPSFADVAQVAADARQALALVDDSAATERAMVRAIEQTQGAYVELAAELSTARRNAATRFAGEVEALLPELGMPDGRLSVQLAALPDAAATGTESVEWMVGVNAGDSLRPLARVASGGELARVMLAVSTVLSRVQSVPTIIFDEIDAGIGGAVALRVGAAMQRLSAAHQVLAVTHLAQIAACADTHGAVSKVSADGRTAAQLVLVDGAARIGELARMLGGDSEREVAREHARALLEQAQTPAPAAAGPRRRQRRA
jgi:DNA repair protein RecN (Recombination protein N)